MTKIGPNSLIKNFPTLGEVEYKIASSANEIEQALSLVYREYAKRGLIDRKNYKHEIRISPHHILPQTKIFVGLKNGEVIITMSTFFDSPLGLPLDQGYHEEFQKVRDEGRKIGEAGYLAVKSGMFRGKKSIFHQLEKIDFICTIFRVAIQSALYFTDTDDACFVTNPDPKRKFFKIFPFEIIGQVKNFGFDEMHVNPKPAIAKKMNFRKLREIKKNPLRLFDLQNFVSLLMIGPPPPKHLFHHELHLTKQELYLLFVEKSDVLKNMKESELDYVLPLLGLTRNDYHELLTKKPN